MKNKSSIFFSLFSLVILSMLSSGCVDLMLSDRRQKNYDFAKPKFVNLEYKKEIKDQGVSALVGKWRCVQTKESWERKWKLETLLGDRFWRHDDKWLGSKKVTTFLELSRDGTFSYSSTTKGERQPQESSGKWEYKNGILLLSSSNGRQLKRILWHSAEEFEIRNFNEIALPESSSNSNSSPRVVTQETYLCNSVVSKKEAVVLNSKVSSEKKTYLTPEVYVRAEKETDAQFTYAENKSGYMVAGVSQVVAKTAKPIIGTRSNKYALLPDSIGQATIYGFSSDLSGSSAGTMFGPTFSTVVGEKYIGRQAKDLPVSMCSFAIPCTSTSIYGIYNAETMTFDLDMKEMGSLKVGLYGECEVTEKSVNASMNLVNFVTTRRYVCAKAPYRVEVEFPEFKYKVCKDASWDSVDIPLPQVDKDRDIEVKIRYLLPEGGKTERETKALIGLVTNKVFVQKVRLYADAIPPTPDPKEQANIQIIHLDEPKSAYVVQNWKPNEDKTLVSFDVLIQSKSKTAFDIDKMVRKEIVEKLTSEYRLKNPGADSSSIGVYIADYELKNGKELHYNASVFSYVPVAESLSYDANTHRGSIAVRISGSNMDAARKWAILNIENLVKTKNVVLEAGKAPPPNAKYRCLNESIKDSVLTIQFESVD